jgi:1-phosphatidylinositol-4-phosphate 5-kinase
MTNAFRAVRALSNIDEADYMLSLAGDFNYIEFIANSKSGQFFFYSHDGRYMIKTQSKEESKFLRRIMPQYINHLTQNPDSLLVRFYGMHRVKMKSLQSKTYFVIMSSVFNTSKTISIKYDLKGSTIGRLTSIEDCQQGAVQKDLNLMQSSKAVSVRQSTSFSHSSSCLSWLLSLLCLFLQRIEFD